MRVGLRWQALKLGAVRGVAALFVLSIAAPSFAAGENECHDKPAPNSTPGANSNQHPPDLTGHWSTPDGEVEIHFLQDTGRVNSYFNSGGDCRFGGHRGKYIDGKFDGEQIKGRMWRCTHLKIMVEKCKLPSVFDTEFYTESVTKDRIVGCYKTEYYAPAKKGGPGGGSSGDSGSSGSTASASDNRDSSSTSGECPYTPDPSGDRYLRFVMTRKGEHHCPDMAEVKHIDDIAVRAGKMVSAITPKVSDQKMRNVLQSSAGALEAAARVLDLLVDAGQKCDEIADAMDELRDFKDAIDEVNNAACGQRSAAAFDHLFTAAGKVGESFVHVEGLGAIFKLLAANESFFQDVSAGINPEVRWADQFAGIEGYTPACPSL